MTDAIYGHDVLRGVLTALSDDVSIKPSWRDLDLKARILARAIHVTHTMEPLTDSEFAEAMRDVDLFLEKVSAHEYSQADAREVLAALKNMQDRSAEKRDYHIAEMERLTRIIRAYTSGSSHMVALEQQWRAYRFNGLLAKAANAYRNVGALQLTTIDTLRGATAYCWAPTPVEAVASAAASLQPEMALSPTALCDLGHPTAAGWWWFEEPIPIRTLDQAEPVAALLWRREVHPVDGCRVWMSLFVMEDKADVQKLFENIRTEAFATPTAAWVWPDGVSLADLPARLKEGYARLEAQGLGGYEAANIDVTVQASLWFSRFFLAAATWLRQRIVVPERGTGVRQVARRIQREQKLELMPIVEIVQLRRRAVVHRETPSDEERKLVNWTCRWGVIGHMRNQWHQSTSTHAPRWIDSYVKGNSSLPFKPKVKIYAVER